MWLPTRLLLTGLTLAFASACASPTTPDAGEGLDAGPRADALPAIDTGPRADAAAQPDAEPTDAVTNDDAMTEPDAMADAGANPDAAAPDAADPCAPVPRAAGAARFGEAFATWLARCNPELTAAEAQVGGLFAVATAAPAFEDLNLSYDDVAAGGCGCAIAAAPCDRLATLRAISACDATFVSTATTYDACVTDLDCPSRHTCSDQNEVRRTTIPGRPPLTVCGGGTCLPLAAVGEDCDNNQVCEPGTHCNYDKFNSVCEANAALGEECSDSPCIGDSDDVPVLPPNYCYYTKANATCQPRERGAMGSCAEGRDCHELYFCDDNRDCQLRPGDGDACETSIDTATPDYVDRINLFAEAPYACRIPAGVADNRGWYCTQTGTTTGVARCLQLPAAGQACGVGQNLAPHCQGGAYCAGIDEETLAPISALCVPRLVEGSTCTPSQFELGAACELGLVCAEPPEQQPMCVDPCDRQNS